MKLNKKEGFVGAYRHSIRQRHSAARYQPYRTEVALPIGITRLPLE